MKQTEETILSTTNLRYIQHSNRNTLSEKDLLQE
jgi:hypothetical protein